MNLDLQGVRLSRQRGFLIPFALFILLAGSVMLGIMFRQVNQETDVNLTAVFYDQSVHAARAGAELTLSRVLLPIDSRQQADARCASVPSVLSYNLEGLKTCTIDVSCDCHYDTDVSCNSADAANYNNSGATRSVYRVNATAVCGDAAYSGRSVQVLLKEYPN